MASGFIMRMSFRRVGSCEGIKVDGPRVLLEDRERSVLPVRSRHPERAAEGLVRGRV